jgi:hypothetical protein
MMTAETCYSRGTIEQIAGSLQQMLETVPESRQRRQLAECAAKLKAVARTIEPDSEVPICRSALVLEAARLCGDRMGHMQRSSILLLGILLAAPGLTHPSREIATAIGISPQSVRVFAFHLRKWLLDEGYPDGLRSQWGLGYMILPLSAAAILAGEPLLQQLVDVIRQQSPADLRQAA